jgi:hypothetical protein
MLEQCSGHCSGIKAHNSASLWVLVEAQLGVGACPCPRVRAGKQRNLAPGRMPGVTALGPAAPAALKHLGPPPAGSRVPSLCHALRRICATSQTALKNRLANGIPTKNKSKNSVEGRLTRHGLPPRPGTVSAGPICVTVPPNFRGTGRGHINRCVTSSATRSRHSRLVLGLTPRKSSRTSQTIPTRPRSSRLVMSS